MSICFKFRSLPPIPLKSLAASNLYPFPTAPGSYTIRSLINPNTRKMSAMKKVFTSEATPAQGPYSQAIIVGPTIFLSGQIPMDSKGNLVDGSIGDKTEACISNVKAILKEAGSDISKVVKTTVFLDNMANFGPMNEVYEKHFTHLPARSCVAVKQLPKGVPVEIECIALA